MFSKNSLTWLAALPLMLTLSGAKPAASEPDPADKALRFDQVEAYMYEGYQPLDVVARVVDGYGDAVDDADVRVIYDGHENLVLKSIGKGYYLGCDIAYAQGTPLAAVEAKKKDWLAAYTNVKSQPGNYCGAGEPQLHVSEPVAAKPDGMKQPLDLYVDVTDEVGNPVKGAKLLARVTDYETFVDAPLIDMGNGRYMACSFGYFNGWGHGATGIHVRAEETGYRPGESDGTNDVGRLCSLSR